MAANPIYPPVLPDDLLSTPLRAENERIRSISRSTNRRVLRILEQNGLVMSPNGAYARELFGAQADLPNYSSHVYYSFVHEKIGSTSNLIQRRNFYVEQHNGQDPELLVLYSPDMHTTPAIDAQMKEIVVNQQLQQMIDCDEIPPEQRNLFEIIRNEGGWKCGIGRQLVLQACEGGLQARYGYDQMQEAFMWDDVHYQRRNQYAWDVATAIAQNIGNLHRFDRVHFLDTWRPGSRPDKLQTKPLIVQQLCDEWRDALPFAVFPNAATVDQEYSTAYTPAQIRHAIDNVITPAIQEAGDPSHGRILFLDRNMDPIFGNNPERLNSILAQEGFDQVLSAIRALPGLTWYPFQIKCHFRPFSD